MLTVRYNTMRIDSLQAFAGIRGGIRQECKDVYFVRALGISGTFQNEVQDMDRQLSVRMNAGQVFYTRVSSLPPLASPDEISFYQKQYNSWHTGGRVLFETRSTQSDDLARLQSLAMRQCLRLLSEWKSGVSESIEKNFVIKVMGWIDAAAGAILSRYSPAMSVKIVLENITKPQEYLFAYFLTQLGFDVLLLQTRADIEGKLIDSGLSCSFTVGPYSDVSLPHYRPEQSIPEQKTPAQHTQATPTVSASTPKLSAASLQRPNRSVRTAPPPVSAPLPRPVQIERPFKPDQGRRARIEKSFEELAKLASSVVMIAVCDNSGHVKGSGSGIMIGENGYILTNFHVAKNGRSYAVRIEDDEEIYTTDEVIKYNALLDLAVIRIRRKLRPIPLYQGGQDLVRGQKVVAIGSPLGLFNSVSDGIIAGFRKVNDVDMIQFTAPISHGSSGGAVLNMYGEVIGISTAGIDEGQNINLAVGYESIAPFIRGFV
ncbi:MAG: trypsin-like peptidase domain-containing protein [Oscillospiraceae bacterium]|nr:trypsin-like peptidase domain-containing protein [Oscillospiraceae bacterium]